MNQDYPGENEDVVRLKASDGLIRTNCCTVRSRIVGGMADHQSDKIHYEFGDGLEDLDEYPFYSDYNNIEWGVSELVLPTRMFYYYGESEKPQRVFDNQISNTNHVVSIPIGADVMLINEEGSIEPCSHPEENIKVMTLNEARSLDLTIEVPLYQTGVGLSLSGNRSIRKESMVGLCKKCLSIIIS